MSTQHTPYDTQKCTTPDQLLTVLGMQEGYRQCVVDYTPLLEAAKAMHLALGADVSFSGGTQLTTAEKRQLFKTCGMTIAAAEARNV